MITHAEYSAAYPLPHFPPLTCLRAVDAPKGVGRVFRLSNDDNSDRFTTDEAVLAELSTTEWRSASYISIGLQFSPEAVRRRLVKRHMEAITERRMVNGCYEWRLK